MPRTIYRERIPSTDPRLRRHVLHDSESRRYPFPTEGLSIVNVVHPRHIDILDQGQVGSCTGNAGIGCLATDPLFVALPEADPGAVTTTRYALNEVGALALYSDAENIDGDGPYPPNDFGSTGLSIAKALLAAGEISGYQHTFSLDDALKALSVTPFITGVPWYQDSFNPDSDGRLHITGALAGGHEVLVRECDADSERVWIDNSWGADWGVNGRGYWTFADFGTLLSQQGDVTILLPANEPAPTPTPVPTPPAPPSDADHALAAVAHPWVREHHTPLGHNEGMAEALKHWMAARGL